MYKNEKQEIYYLYDKERGYCTRRFVNLFEVREFIKERLESKLHECLWPYNTINVKHPYNLSMCIEDTYSAYERVHTVWDSTANDYKCNTYIEQVAYNTEVIISSEGRIFNYTEIVNELIAYSNHTNITYGMGHTYSGGNKVKKGKVYARYNGQKRVHCNYGRLSLPINVCARFKNTKIETVSIVEDCKDCGYDISETIVEKALRHRKEEVTRRMYTTRHRYVSTASWKTQKKTRQWQREKNGQRIVSKYKTSVEDTEDILKRIYCEN